MRVLYVCHDHFVGDRRLWRARHCLRRLGDFERDGRARGLGENAGDRSGGARGRAGLSQSSVHDDRRCRRRHLRHPRAYARLAGRRRLPDRRCPVRRDGLHRHERVGARQRPYRAGRDQVACRRPRARLQGRRDHRPSGCRSRAPRGHHLLHVPHGRPQAGSREPHRHRLAGRAWLRRLADLDLRSAGRRYLHQGCGRRRRPGRQG